MSRLNQYTLETAPAESQPFVERSIAANGYLPNLISVLAGSPSVLQAYFKLGELNAQGALSLAEREAVQITAAVTHGCAFCTAGHSAVALKKAGYSQAEVLALHHGLLPGRARLDALVQFTRDVIAARGAVSEAAYQAFRAADYSERQALEVVLGVSLATLCNFANNLAQPEINEQLRPYSIGVLGSTGAGP